MTYEPTPEALDAVAGAINRHYDEEFTPLVDIDNAAFHPVARAVLAFLAEHPEHIPGIRQAAAHGVPLGDDANPIVMSTFDGTGRRFTRWFFQTPWQEETP